MGVVLYAERHGLAIAVLIPVCPEERWAIALPHHYVYGVEGINHERTQSFSIQSFQRFQH
jgi:hypothetical protein